MAVDAATSPTGSAEEFATAVSETASTTGLVETANLVCTNTTFHNNRAGERGGSVFATAVSCWGVLSRNPAIFPGIFRFFLPFFFGVFLLPSLLFCRCLFVMAASLLVFVFDVLFLLSCSCSLPSCCCCSSSPFSSFFQRVVFVVVVVSQQDTTLELHDCNSTSNLAALGASMYMSQSTGILTNCTFAGDKVSRGLTRIGEGGGIRVSIFEAEMLLRHR